MTGIKYCGKEVAIVEASLGEWTYMLSGNNLLSYLCLEKWKPWLAAKELKNPCIALQIMPERWFLCSLILGSRSKYCQISESITLFAELSWCEIVYLSEAFYQQSFWLAIIFLPIFLETFFHILMCWVCPFASLQNFICCKSLSITTRFSLHF